MQWRPPPQDWNIPLGNNLDHLFILADTPLGVQAFRPQDYAKWFSRYRDRFRNRLSRMDPKPFPHRGPVLEVMFGRVTGPYVVQHLICRDCGTLSRVLEREFCFPAMCYGQEIKTPTWLHDVWAEFIHRSKTDMARSQARCSQCQGRRNAVQSLEMPDAPWIWFERHESSLVWPLLALTLNSPPQQLAYSLQAIIYAGGNHFTVRFRDKSGRWWRHDGRAASGVLQPNDIQSDAQLLMNGTRFACRLIYRRDGH